MLVTLAVGRYLLIQTLGLLYKNIFINNSKLEKTC